MPRRQICGVLILALLFGGILPSASLAKDETVEEIGDYLQFVLPIAAWGSTFIAGAPDGSLWDKEGTKQATLSIGSALATMTAAKYIVAKTRPSGKDRTSYPSGHTCGAFSGAVFLDRRYGWK
jgi:membrane-associated phospholipid phosphatase